MQTECPHRKFCRLDATHDELSPQAAERFDKLALFDRLRREDATEATALMAAGCFRATPCRWKRRLRCGDRGRKPGQMVQIDHPSVAIEAGFSVKESGAVCPVSKLCCMRACSRATAACRCELRQSCAGELSVGALNVELAEFERLCNACRPHQALGQAVPCRRIMKTSNKAHLTPEKSHMY